MTENMFDTVLRKAGCERDETGLLRLPEGRTMTLYIAHDGTQLAVGKVMALKRDEALVETETVKGETFILSLEDLFAASVSGNGKSAGGRKAGFLD